MNSNHRIIRTCRLGGALLLVAMSVPRGSAVSGVMDSVVIVGDATDEGKWIRESQKWDELIRTVEAEVDNTSKLIELHQEWLERAGVTHQAVAKQVGSVADIMQPLDEAMTLETMKHALESSRNLYANGSNAVKIYNPANDVGPTYDAFGDVAERDKPRYAHFAMQEALYARYRTAAKNEEAVQQAEAEFQREALERLKQVRTEAEVAVLSASLAASKQRQDLAHQRTTQARGDLEAFRGQLTFESNRKAEADREWAQHVTARMRDKALAAYRRQHGEAEAFRN